MFRNHFVNFRFWIHPKTNAWTLNVCLESSFIENLQCDWSVNGPPHEQKKRSESQSDFSLLCHLICCNFNILKVFYSPTFTAKSKIKEAEKPPDFCSACSELLFCLCHNKLGWLEDFLFICLVAVSVSCLLCERVPFCSFVTWDFLSNLSGSSQRVCCFLQTERCSLLLGWKEAQLWYCLIETWVCEQHAD